MKKSLPKPMYSALLFFFFLTSQSCSSTSTTHHHNHDEEVSYTDHCSSIVPESTPITNSGFKISSFPRSLTGYSYTTASGSDGNLSQNPVRKSDDSLDKFSFSTRKVLMTTVDGVFKVEAMVELESSNIYYYNGNANYTNTNSEQVGANEMRFNVVSLRLNGFWSESSGKLCMVGPGTTHSKETEDLINLAAVLKLNYLKNSRIITSLVTGSLESLNSVGDSSYFEKVSVFTFAAKRNYGYSLVLKEFDNGCFNGSGDVTKSLPISSQPCNSLCSLFQSSSITELKLKYPSNCKSAKNCTPFAENIGYLPSVMALNSIHCSDCKQRVRVLVAFPNNSYGGYYRSFNPNTTLIGEGLWDRKKNQLCIVACKILNVSGSLDDAHIGDCSIRMTLRLPAVWSIKDSRSIIGQIWSSKPVNDSEYFDRIVCQSSAIRDANVQGLKYEYTLVDKARKLCPSKKAHKNKMERYPNVYSFDMIFDLSVSSSKEGRFGWGYSTPLFVGDQYYSQFQSAVAMAPSSSGKGSEEIIVPVNISYKMSFSDNSNSNPYMLGEISAEGIYDPNTGDLCMIGCKNIDSKSQVPKKDSLDCEILVKCQFSLTSKDNGGYIKGSIESTRGKMDPLYFEALGFFSSAFIPVTTEENSSRMDFEVTMVIISITLVCVFVAFQLFYVRKHPQMLPFASLAMLVVLTLGYIILLLLNFDVLSLQNRDRENDVLKSGKWLQADEALVWLVTMVAFNLQFRLQLMTWFSRVDDGGGAKKDIWGLEKKAFLYVSLPLYAASAFIVCLENQQNNKNNNNNRHLLQHSIWGGLKTYGGMVMDTFLLPQIILNMFGNTKEKALSFAYYMGSTFVRFLPHAYDLYRAHSSNNT